MSTTASSRGPSHSGGDSGPAGRLERLARFVRNEPAVPGLIVMAAVGLVGFLALLLAYAGAARTIYVPLQVPEILSGGFGGLALIGLAASLISIQVGRRDAAEERRMTDEVLEEMAEVMALAPHLRRITEERRRIREKKPRRSPRSDGAAEPKV